MQTNFRYVSRIAASSAFLFIAALPAFGGTTTFSYTGTEGGGHYNNSVNPGCCLWVNPASDGNIGVGSLLYTGLNVTGSFSFDSANWSLSSSTANSATYSYSGQVSSTETWLNGSDPWTFDFNGYRSASMTLTTHPQGSTADTIDLTLVGRQAGSGYYYYSTTDLILIAPLNSLNVSDKSWSGVTVSSFRIYHDFMDSPSNVYAGYQTNSGSGTISVEGAGTPEPASVVTALTGLGLCLGYSRRRRKV